jgi:hypothetical protein
MLYAPNIIVTVVVYFTKIRRKPNFLFFQRMRRESTWNQHRQISIGLFGNRLFQDGAIDQLIFLSHHFSPSSLLDLRS